MSRKRPSYVGFNNKEYKRIYSPDINYRDRPGRYVIGKGQQGVLICQPYKGELLPHWRFKTPELAHDSATKIYSMFLEYLKGKDFVGADMAKKYLHMGFTRSRRYANHSSGTKWKEVEGSREVLPQEEDCMVSDKAVSAEIFKVHWDLARTNEEYLRMKKKHREEYVYNYVRTEYEIRKEIYRERKH